MTEKRRKATASIVAAALTMAVSVSAFAAGPASPGGHPQGGENGPVMMQGSMAGIESQTPGDNGQQAPVDNGQQAPPDQNNMKLPPCGEMSGRQEKDQINAILQAVDKVEDSNTKSNLQTLLDAHLKAIQEEQKAADEESRKAACLTVLHRMVFAD